MKRGACILLVLMVVFSASLAVAEPSVEFGPLQLYETNEVSFAFNLSNYGTDFEVTGVHVDIEYLEILAMVDYAGWTESYNGSIAEWTEGSIGSNVVLALFEYLAEAPLVDEDTDADIEILLFDDEGDEQEYEFKILILNDISPPVLSDILPEDGSFVKEGTTDQLVQINATDPQTGIANVSFHWVRCDFEENITPQDHSTQLVEQDGLYQNNIDFSAYENEDVVCFDFSAYNKGGEVSHYDGQLTIDGIPPTVTLVSPDDSAIIGAESEFSFYTGQPLINHQSYKNITKMTTKQ